MKLFLFSVQDTKVGAFLPPFAARAKGEAVRSFTAAVQDDKHQFSQHRADYSLWVLAEFDDSTGELVPYKPERVIGADEI